jgi:hypothetical protein
MAGTGLMRQERPIVTWIRTTGKLGVSDEVKNLSGIFICSHAPIPAVIASGHRMNKLTVPTAALSTHLPAPISTSVCRYMMEEDV